ncbi:MAG: tRNA (adenosine(37)-N6)-threonylcarbamoyltransferase complex ATPase subunit type 1 TsaE [Candidatus Krumholzibacteria bacterium]|nr:tRNA (adenosine(37)-N6)-threonylcarbamoyltransferase complex ATPase subunit type 1 TsaE [Candidatus Krumholzibacteria bacterium]MDH4336951.1 tRNA (adenosine(37)-N6)-threonylcarbamoyltransferase complex ATPase subunit type 1 TsaE [Candidatus Krumholzibacteria bacterium]MDH5269753.1 tRNA (adenosine(37)-N6)-threonylcarbamoyltransferase complex ATPase subunit type 1 TsaE [Candidatus Krumholzibacteria bacterium]MDH5627056.1 tRNA (adenosine(37)-N6)-threonylcarbamoyltransferase complex ATPase subuni
MRRTTLYTLRTRTDGETERFGAALGERIRRGLAVCISGPLGAGKTVLVRGVCRGLGVEGPVVSPTFILMEMLEGRLSIAHVDLYRLEHERELEEIGVFDLADDDTTVVLAEWGERSPALLAAADVEIRIQPDGEQVRVITVAATAQAAEQIGGIPW